MRAVTWQGVGNVRVVAVGDDLRRVTVGGRP
jgi:hypothetical protein